jgi:hypothetical protein
MRGVIFNKQSGRILRYMHCPDLKEQIQSDDEDFLITDWIATTEYCVDLQTKTLVPVTPPKTIIDVIAALREEATDSEIDALIQAVDSHKAVADWRKENYAELRHNTYPNIIEFVDAQVKINSGNTVLISQGRQEMTAYVNKCLAVKARFPKPQTKKEK